MLLFSDVLDMLVRYASPSGPMYLRCLMLTLSGLWNCCYCFIAACCGECYVSCLQFECFPINVSVCFVCFMLDCVGEVYVFSLKVMVLL